MKVKETLVYLNPDSFTDTDVTVLKYLAERYNVVWFYIHQSRKQSRYTVEWVREYAEHNNLEVRIRDPKCRNRSVKNFFFYKEIADEINDLNPVIVYHAHRDPYWNLVIALKLKCKKVVLGIHDAQIHSYGFSLSKFLEEKTNKFCLKLHSYFFTFSMGQKDLLKKIYGIDSIMVGMSCKDFGEPKEFASPIERGVKLLFFGTINKYKGLDLLIMALESLWKQGVKSIKLTIAGRGPFWQECEKYVKNREMYNFQIRFIDNSEIPDLMSSHHFLVLPYRDATQSGPLLTAVNYELPVIAPNYGCFSSTYDENSAFLYEDGMLEQTLLKISAQTNIEYELMKKKCKQIKNNNSEGHVAGEYIKAFESIT